MKTCMSNAQMITVTEKTGYTVSNTVMDVERHRTKTMDRDAMPDATEVRVGQIWRNTETGTLVEIMDVFPGTTRQIKVRSGGLRSRRSYWVGKDRFNGKRGGYELVQG